MLLHPDYRLNYFCYTTDSNYMDIKLYYNAINVLSSGDTVSDVCEFPPRIISAVRVSVKHLYEKRESQGRNTQKTHPIYLHSSSKY